MALPITFNNTVYQAGFFGTDDGGVPTNATRSFRIDDTYDFPVTLNGTVTDSNSTVTLTYTLPGNTTPTTETLKATGLDNPNQILFLGSNGVPGSANGTTNRYVFSNTQMFGSGNPNRTTFADDGNGTGGDYVVPVCFTTGTLIRTARGEIAVEALQVGDMAVTASGALRPITWIGHRELGGAGKALSDDQRPVRVRADAFGPGLPARDLRLSPGHPVLVGADADGEGGVLVPIMCLINGTSIARLAAPRVTYWHVELDAHDILLAEGLPAESYLDGGNRLFFTEGSDHALHNPDFVPPGWNGRCRPVAVDGPLVEAERTRLGAVFAAELTGHCGWVAPESWRGA